MSDAPTPLAAEFDAPDAAAWRALVEQALRGRDFERALVSRTADGIAVEPLYRRQDRPADGAGMPGAYPFTRGDVGPHAHEAWQIRQLCATPLADDANRVVIEELEHGSSAIEIRIDRRRRLWGEAADGVCIAGPDDIRTLLRRIDVERVPLALDAGPFFAEIADMLRQSGARSVAINADPLAGMALGEMAADGGVEAAVALARGLPDGWTALRACGEVYHAAGASDGQELAAVIATGIAYLRALVDGGPSSRSGAAASLRLRLAVDTDIFAGIAKLRAARRLWARVLDVRRCNR